jgi:hypothetical protein
MAGWRGRWTQRRSQCQREEVAGVTESGATSLGLTNRGYWEEAEMKATSPEPFAWLGRGLRGTRHGRRWKELAGAHGYGTNGHVSQR